MNSYTARNPLYCIVPSETNLTTDYENYLLPKIPDHLSHREPPELVMMGGKLEPQNLSMRGE